METIVYIIGNQRFMATKNAIFHNGSTIVPTFVLHLIINELVTLHRKVDSAWVSRFSLDFFIIKRSKQNL